MRALLIALVASATSCGALASGRSLCPATAAPVYKMSPPSGWLQTRNDDYQSLPLTSAEFFLGEPETGKRAKPTAVRKQGREGRVAQYDFTGDIAAPVRLLCRYYSIDAALVSERDFRSSRCRIVTERHLGVLTPISQSCD
jgi:hypothetical protein